MKTALVLLGSLAPCLLVSVACTPTSVSEPQPEPAQSLDPTPATSSTEADSTYSTPYNNQRSNVLLIGPIPDNSEDCGSLSTQTAMNLCAKRNADASRKQLRQIGLLISDSLDQAGKTSFAHSETAWAAFRDLDCRFASSQFAGGSIESLIYGDCLTNHNLARMKELAGEVHSTPSYSEADRQLNESYQDLQSVLSTPRQEALIDVQLAWIEYRDRNCAYEASYSPTFTGTEDQCLARMSQVRANDLQQAVQQNSL